MVQFHTLSIADVIRETKDAVSISFEIPEQLKEPFSYKPGQYLTLKVPMPGGEEERRAYSMSSSPHVDPRITVTVKRIEDGKVSNYLNDEAAAGIKLEVLEPMGRFTPVLHPEHEKQYVLFGGGSGITPLFSILKSVLSQEPRSRVTLFYGNRDPQSIIFRDTLAELDAHYGERLQIVHTVESPDDAWTGDVGRLDSARTRRYIQDYVGSWLYSAEYYICGPSPMMDQVIQGLKQFGIDEDRIYIERFTKPVPQSDAEQARELAGVEASGQSDGSQPTPAQTPDTAGDNDAKTATVVLNGEENTIEVGLGEVILDAALENDLDPPFACRMGICTTCRAKLLEGEAEMDENEGLTDEEMEDGYILTCQAHPTTSHVKVDYDA